MQKRELRFILWMGLIVYFGISSVWQIFYTFAPTGFTAAIAPVNSSAFQQLKVLIYPFILVSLGMYYFVLSNSQEVVLTNIQGKNVKHLPMENVTKHRSFLTAMMISIFVMPLVYIALTAIAINGNVGAVGNFIFFAVASLAAFVTAYALLVSKIKLEKLFFVVLPIFVILLIVFILLNFFTPQSVFFYL